MSKTKFDLPSFKYENLSNRMDRLRYSQNQTSSTMNLRSASVDRNSENKTLTRASSTAMLASPSANQTSHLTYLQEESCLDVGSRYCGRVAKNTGIRKYNQRMLKEVGNINKKTPPKYTAPQSIKVQMLKNEALILNRQNYSSPLKKDVQNLRSDASQIISKANAIKQKTHIRMQTFEKGASTPVRSDGARMKLQPGKIYAREELEKYFGL